ncbi:MazG family protein [Actinophytocola gossypii]|uniref:MazG family protein n=1 Tax=Actinophytocola gossypii TaxID=2812003 RepID=A0ABT2J5A1_9PSEU|nr:MazG family protein [Actinophytocola gossypii]MCT2583041.1 MazG family protein [Actinophytocola gossypii]
MTAAGPAGSTVVLVDRDQLPAAAVPLLRSTDAVFATGKVDLGLPFAPPDLTDRALAGPLVLVTDDLDDPAAAALLARGASVLAAPRAGAALLDAVAVMDRLRSPGGCPWDAEQTHESLRVYLVEECFELLDAIDDGDRTALREELGDVLLQVLFHARVAEEHPDDPFSLDDVAGALVAKLVGRHPHVFAGGDPAVHDASTQQVRWEELKQQEKRRESSVDGVATGQPALALAAKLVSRTARANLPPDLLPDDTDTGARLFAIAADAKLAGADPEGELRAVARRFAADVRAAERAARAAGTDPATMDADTWRRHWPGRTR